MESIWTQKTNSATEDFPLAKRVNRTQFLLLITNTDRPVNSAADNNKSLSKTNFVKRRPENYACPSVFAP